MQSRKFVSDQLQQQYQKDASFRKKIDKAQAQYFKLYMKSLQSHKSDQIDDAYFEKFISKSKSYISIYFIYGFLQPDPGRSTSLLTLNFIRRFLPAPDQQFIFVYFNNKTTSSDYYKQFQNIFLMLPMKMLQGLKTFILVKPTFYLKAVNYFFGSVSKYFNKKYQQVQNCLKLCERFQINTHDFVSFVPEELAEGFPQNFKRRQSLSRFRMNLFGQNLTASQISEKKQFDESINALINAQVFKLQNYEMGELGIPIVLQLLIGYFKSKPQGLDSQGIFRKSVSVDEQEETLNQLTNKNYEYLNQIKNPYLIASLIKKFFYHLKEPVIPFKAFADLMSGSGNQLQPLKKVITQLPKLNFVTLMYLMQFLTYDVVSRSDKNKMTAQNIAIVFSPTLMKSQVPSQMDLVYAAKSVTLTHLILKHFIQIFGSQQERKQIYKQNINQHSLKFERTILLELEVEQSEKLQVYEYSQASQANVDVDKLQMVFADQDLGVSFLKKSKLEQTASNTNKLEQTASKTNKLRLSQREALSLSAIRNSQVSINEKLQRVSSLLQASQLRFITRKKTENINEPKQQVEQTRQVQQEDPDKTVKIQINYLQDQNYMRFDQQQQQEQYDIIDIPSPGGSPRNSQGDKEQQQKQQVLGSKRGQNLTVSQASSNPPVRKRSRRTIVKYNQPGDKPSQ